MRRFTTIAASLIFAAFLAMSAHAQAPAAGTTGKIGIVNSYAFTDEKAGIAKFRTAMSTLETEFKPVNDELKTLATKYQTLGTEIQNLQKTASTNSTVPVNTSGLQAKIDEFQALETSIKRKQEDAKARYEKRQQAVVGPIYADILKAMSDFARQKGFAIILDGPKLEESGLLMGFDDKYDVTKDFVAFYNARPAGAATAAAAPAK